MSDPHATAVLDGALTFQNDSVGNGMAGPEDEPDAVIGQNLRRLRKHRGLTLEQLAQVSGVSRAMLGQIELSRSVPTIRVLCKIARALDLPVSALLSQHAAERTHVMRVDSAKVLWSAQGAVQSRALFPMDVPRKVEFHELVLNGLAIEEAHAHPAGTTEHLVVNQGAIRLTVGEYDYELGTGDAILFDADVPHCYRNPDPTAARMFRVVVFPDRRY